MADRARVGVVGCGLIAQVMHLPYLAELPDRFEIAAVCDLREDVAAGCAGRFRVPRVCAHWEELLDEPLDAVLIATSGDHAPMTVAAARAGLHVFVEKPMALSSADGERMVEAAREAGVRLMVGTMKRYDPAYERLAELLPAVSDVRMISVTTLESPFAPNVAHYPLIGMDFAAPGPPLEIGDQERAAIARALGEVDETTRWCYPWIMLDNLVHELNMLGGLLGAPDEIRFARLSPRSVSIDMRFGETDCHLSWVELPGIARYRQELSIYAPAERLTLELPSPFLRSMPSRLFIEEGEIVNPTSWVREEIVSYEEAFKRELVEFSECMLTGREPRTSGEDGLRDMRVAEAVARTHAASVAGSDRRDGASRLEAGVL
jgi:predicted dehydrogenase